MIDLSGKKFPEINGCKNFGFRTKYRTECQYTRPSRRTRNVAGHQSVAVHRILCTAKQFTDVPCEVNIQVGVHEGLFFLHGTVYAAGKESFDRARQILSTIQAELKNFITRFPTGGFTVSAEQSIEFYNIQR